MAVNPSGAVLHVGPEQPLRTSGGPTVPWTATFGLGTIASPQVSTLHCRALIRQLLGGIPYNSIAFTWYALLCKTTDAAVPVTTVLNLAATAEDGRAQKELLVASHALLDFRLRSVDAISSGGALVQTAVGEANTLDRPRCNEDPNFDVSYIALQNAIDFLRTQGAAESDPISVKLLAVADTQAAPGLASLFASYDVGMTGHGITVSAS